MSKGRGVWYKSRSWWYVTGDSLLHGRIGGIFGGPGLKLELREGRIGYGKGE